MIRHLRALTGALLLGLLVAGCVMIDDPAPPAGNVATGPDPRFELQGTWVVSAFRGTDGKTQSLDTSDPAQTITYVFDGAQLTIDWGGRGTDVGTAKWRSIASDGTGKLVVHITQHAEGTGEIGTSQSGDVVYDVAPIRRTDKGLADRVTFTADGQQMVLQKRA